MTDMYFIFTNRFFNFIFFSRFFSQAFLASFPDLATDKDRHISNTGLLFNTSTILYINFGKRQLHIGTTE